jgi:hypothetical protein
MTFIDLKSRPPHRPFQRQQEALVSAEIFKSFEGFRRSRQNLDQKIGPVAHNNVASKSGS